MHSPLAQVSFGASSDVFQTAEQLRGDIGTFGDGQGQGFTKKFLRS